MLKPVLVGRLKVTFHFLYYRDYTPKGVKYIFSAVLYKSPSIVMETSSPPPIALIPFLPAALQLYACLRPQVITV